VRLSSRLTPTQRNALLLICLAGYVAGVSLVAARHEPWRDEADTWLQVRDSGLGELIGRFAYFGTPGLWYLLLYPLPRLGLPYESQAALHVILASCAVSVLLWRGALPLTTRVLFAFSYLMAYEYAVVARSYVLSVLLLFLIAAHYGRRREQPLMAAVLIALLFQTNAHSVGIAGALAGVAALELAGARPLEWKKAVSVGLMFVGGLLALLQLRTPPDANITGLISVVDLGALPRSIGQAFLPGFEVEALNAVGVLLAVGVAMTVRRDWRALTFFLGSYAWLAYVFVLKYTGGLRHWGLLAVVALVALWLHADGARRRGEVVEWDRSVDIGQGASRPIGRATLMALNVCLAASCGMAAFFWRLDWQLAYSGGQEMASYLKTLDLGGKTIAAHPPAHSETVLPYLPGVELWYLGMARRGTFMPWDATYRRADAMSSEEALSELPRTLASEPGLLILLNSPIPERYGGEFQLRHQTVGVVFNHRDEQYFLYERRP
jgi:hypothetical protein